MKQLFPSIAPLENASNSVSSNCQYEKKTKKNKNPKHHILDYAIKYKGPRNKNKVINNSSEAQIYQTNNQEPL